MNQLIKFDSIEEFNTFMKEYPTTKFEIIKISQGFDSMGNEWENIYILDSY